uniref:Uncharacterized protein MANES_13G155200 n=1 Tax=Rhizophora mucronata TaxID=61149 RepID=A0A2P2MSC6_RHIMU
MHLFSKISTHIHRKKSENLKCVQQTLHQSADIHTYIHREMEKRRRA